MSWTNARASRCSWGFSLTARETARATLRDGLLRDVAGKKVERRVDAAQRDDGVAQPAADLERVNVVALVVDDLLELPAQPVALLRRRNKAPLFQVELVPVHVRLLLVPFCESAHNAQTEDFLRKKAHDWRFQVFSHAFEMIGSFVSNDFGFSIQFPRTIQCPCFFQFENTNQRENKDKKGIETTNQIFTKKFTSLNDWFVQT